MFNPLYLFYSSCCINIREFPKNHSKTAIPVGIVSIPHLQKNFNNINFLHFHYEYGTIVFINRNNIIFNKPLEYPIGCLLRKGYLYV